MQNATIGLDLVKHVFQVHDVADDGKVVRPVDFRCAPFATKSVRRCSTSFSAKRRHQAKPETLRRLRLQDDAKSCSLA